MKSREKLILMEEKINTINTTILKNNKEYFNGTFATFESVLSALDLILNMFSAELNKKGGK